MGDVVETWSDELVLARQAGVRCAPEGEPPSTTEQAYRIQSQVAARVGPVGGFKTARKGGAAPIMAPIFARDIVASGAEVDVRDMLGVELEIGFQILADLSPDRMKLTDDDLRRLLRPVVAIELVDTRLYGPSASEEIPKLADNQINAGLVVGAALDGWDGSDLGLVEARMRAGSTVVLDGKAMVPGGSALETFRCLARQIGDHCGGLRPGQIVTTGSLHPLVYYPPGTVVEGRVSGLGAVSVRLAMSQDPAM